MDAEIKGDKLHIILDLERSRPSASGKTEVVAGTGGRWRSGLKVSGKSIWIVATAYTYPDKPVGESKEPAKKVGQKRRVSQKGDGQA
jgi:hypothetical protein